MVKKRLFSEMTVEAVAQLSAEHEEVLRKYFGAGVNLPSETWRQETLEQAARIRGLNVNEIFAELKSVSENIKHKT